MKIRKLSLSEMYEIYGYLQGGLVQVTEKTEFTEFADILLEHLKSIPENYIKILQILSGKSEDVILKLSATDALVIFLEGLQKNQILRFYYFVEQLE